MVEAVRHCRAVMGAIRALQTMDDDELYVYAKELQSPIELVRQVGNPVHPPCSGGVLLLCGGSHNIRAAGTWLVQVQYHSPVLESEHASS